MAPFAEHPFSEYRLYVVLHKKEGRRMACLVKPNNAGRTTISYARYLMSVHLGRVLESWEQVDHDDDDKLNDVIDNLKIRTHSDNNRKNASLREFVKFICPECSSEFLVEKRNVPFRAAKPCCSRSCAAKKQRRAEHRVVAGSGLISRKRKLIVGSNPTRPTTILKRRR